MSEPVIDEYGFADYSTGECAIPTRYLFDQDECSEVGPGGDAAPEYWKQVAPDYYISDLGNMYSLKTNKVLKPKRLDRQGHVGYCLSNGSNKKYEYQHRLLAYSFVPKENPKFNVVRHLNSVPDDNDINNLAWGTQKENWQDSYAFETAHLFTPEEREIGLRKTRKPTRAINIHSGETREYASLNDAVRDLGVQQPNACKVLTGKRAHTCGWRFEYIKKELGNEETED